MINNLKSGDVNPTKYKQFLLTVPAQLFLLLLFVYPLVKLITTGLVDSGLNEYVTVFRESYYLKILYQTFEISLLVTLLCLVLGYPLAYFLATTTPFWRLLGFSFVILPLWVSVLVRTYAWMILLGRNGVINKALMGLNLIDTPIGLLNSYFAVVIGMVHVLMPFMVLPIYGAFARLDFSLSEAARGLGAPPRQVFLKILVPLTMRGVVSGVLLVFVLCLGFFITPALLGGGKVSMIAMVIEQQVREFLAWDFAAALTLILLVMTLVGVFLIRLYARRFVNDE